MPQYVGGNQITLLRSGGEYFPALEAAIDSAEFEIYLQTYIFEQDNTGLRIGNALKRAAMRGVQVCLLLDGFGCKDLPKVYVRELEAAGVEVLFYLPKISPWTLERRRLRRMHRKLTVIDGRTGFVGGINIIDDFNTPSQMPPRVDYAVKVEGPLLPGMRTSARLLWRRMCWIFLRPVRISKLQNLSYPVVEGGMRAAFVLRDNLWHRSDIEDAYLSAIKSAKSEIVIANSYFLPGLRFRHALRDAAARGVRVILLLQGRVEYVLLDFASHALYSTLLHHGIEIYEYHLSFMHSKVAVIDGKWATVGSSNIDPFSLLLSREVNVVVLDASFASELREDIQKSMDFGASQVSTDNWERGHYIKRFLSWLVYGMVRLMMGIVGQSSHR
jgi:cardiolipin synthase